MAASSPASLLTHRPLAKQPVTQLKGVGPQLAEKLKKLDIHSLQDLLFHLPFRYEDRTRITPIIEAVQGESAVIEGSPMSCDIAYGRRRSLLCKLRDETGVLALRFYHFSKKQQESLANANRIRCFGEIRRGASGWEIYHPEYKILKGKETLEQNLTPVYATTEGISQARIRQVVNQALDLVSKEQIFPDLLHGVHFQDSLDINEALNTIHNPSRDIDVETLLMGTHPLQRRFAFEELLAHNLGLLRIRQQTEKKGSYKLEIPAESYKNFIQRLDFQLTGAQIKVAGEIAKDMSSGLPMQRLLQGDVGSGKTLVAALAAIHAAENDIQTAIMAPTELLAEQHFLNFSQWLGSFDAPLAWLSGKTRGKQRTEQLGLIASGTAKVVIGTHALFQTEVEFRQLGLIIVDEQHRFGVEQRLALLEKGSDKDGKGIAPHQLSMTATPIPRTLTMSLYADMDTSVIDELPPGRQQISTHVVVDSRRPEVIKRVHESCQTGKQAYWVCTLIDESETLESQAAEETAAKLSAELSDLKVALIHGRMRTTDKTQIMNQFKSGDIDLLVATTVIEVGVDVPNASLMVIENAERLGLAQLHQLRGRVGRGSTESYCLLMYHPPIGEKVKNRLNVLRSSTDGFYISEQDLIMRGPGEILGRRQSGDLEYKIADLSRDSDLLADVRKVSLELLKEDSDLVQAILERWLPLKAETAQV